MSVAQERTAATFHVPRLIRSADALTWWLVLAVAVGLVVRLAMLASPLGELDADEAVVGLMARHMLFNREFPVFYWGQQYLGSLEAFCAAGLFAVFGSSTVALKVVPLAYSLGFLVLSALVARRLFGIGPAVITALYLALPPAMWAVWSIKARGGYAEVLFFGEALLLVTLWVAERCETRAGLLLWGLLAGLGFWTHPLMVVYLIPSALYLVLRRGPRWTVWEIGLALAGVLLGASPVLVYNAANHFSTAAALLAPADLPLDRPAQAYRFFRVGVMVLVGLAQPTTSAAMFDDDWLTRPASHWPIAMAALLVLVLAVILQLPSVRRAVWRARDDGGGPLLLLLLVATVPPVVALTRFGFFVSEPRYALPLYSAAPLLAAALWRLPRPLAVMGAAALLALNGWSILSTNVDLWRPEQAVATNPANRALLAAYLESHDEHQTYTDYWIAYPMMFETNERVLAYVIANGFNRYIPPADNVQRTPNAVWVTLPDTDAEAYFLERQRLTGASAREVDVAGYHVYEDVQPIGPMRPPYPES